MQRTLLQKLISQGLSTWQLAAELGCSQTNIRYWLKRHKLRTKGRISTDVYDQSCAICKGNTTTRRSICAACRTKIRRRRTKAAAVALLGGRCAVCGWVGPYQGFDFHHMDKNKEANIGRCARCHRLAHVQDDPPGLLKAIADYRGMVYKGT